MERSREIIERGDSTSHAATQPSADLNGMLKRRKNTPHNGLAFVVCCFFMHFVLETDKGCFQKREHYLTIYHITSNVVLGRPSVCAGGLGTELSV